MTLVYLLEGARWFVAHENAWFRLQDDAEAELASSVLALDLMDLYDRVEQPLQAGFASVSRDDDAATVRLTATDGTPVCERAFAFDERLLTRVEWLVSPFRDGWHRSETRVLLEGAGAYALKVFLPPSPDAGPKTLRVRQGDDGPLRTVSLERDSETLVTLLDGGSGERCVIHLACDPEPAAQGDARTLGFVVIDDVLEAA